MGLALREGGKSNTHDSVGEKWPYTIASSFYLEIAQSCSIAEEVGGQFIGLESGAKARGTDLLTTLALAEVI